MSETQSPTVQDKLFEEDVPREIGQRMLKCTDGHEAKAWAASLKNINMALSLRADREERRSRLAKQLA